MSGQSNERLDQGAVIILRILFRYGELSVSSISGLLELDETTVTECCDELLAQGLISRRTILVQDSEVAFVRLEAKGRAYLDKKPPPILPNFVAARHRPNEKEISHGRVASQSYSSRFALGSLASSIG